MKSYLAKACFQDSLWKNTREMTRYVKDRKELPQGGHFLGGKRKTSKNPTETAPVSTQLFPQQGKGFLAPWLGKASPSSEATSSHLFCSMVLLFPAYSSSLVIGQLERHCVVRADCSWGWAAAGDPWPAGLRLASQDAPTALHDGAGQARVAAASSDQPSPQR